MNELFIHYLDKVKKNLPKKYIGIKDFLIKMADVLNNNNNHRIFVIFKIIINMRSQKLNEITLQLLLKMISLNYIDGSNEDASSEFYLEEYSELFED